MEQERDDPLDGNRGQQQLLEAFARWSRTYEQILHAASEGIFSLDIEGRISFANTAAARMLGRAVEDMQGLPVVQIALPSSAEALLWAETVEYTHRRQVFRLAQGGEIPVECSLTHILEDGQPVGSVLMFNDITERERAEQALQGSLHALEQVNQRLTETHDQLLHAEKLAAVGQLAAGVAHEINTPLGYIQSNLGTIARHVEDLLVLVDCYERHYPPGKSGMSSEAEAAIAKCRQHSDLDFLREDAPPLLAETRQGISQVSKVVNQLMEFSRVGKEGEWEKENPENICRAAAERAARHRNCFRVEQRYEPLPHLLCLTSRLEQAIQHIIDNALLAIGPEGMVRIRGNCPDDQQVCISIEDNGCGIAPEQLESIFNPFFSTRPVGSGDGMGLAIADTVIRLHKGHITVTSIPGQGSRFQVFLPR